MSLGLPMGVTNLEFSIDLWLKIFQRYMLVYKSIHGCVWSIKSQTFILECDCGKIGSYFSYATWYMVMYNLV